MLLLNPKQLTRSYPDARSREIMAKTVDFFERKGKRKLKADDRDRVYVKLDSDGATVSLQPPEGSRAIIGEPIPDKYAGRTIGAVAHGCRRTFDPKTGASGLEKAYEQTSQLPRQSLVEQK